MLDGIVPEEKNQEYTIVLLAEPVQNQLELQNELCQYYSDLFPYSSWQTNNTYSEADNSSGSFTLGMNAGVGAGFNIRTGAKNTIGRFVPKCENGEFRQTSLNSEESSNGTGVGLSANFGVNFNRASSINITVEKSEGITQNYTNYSVKHTLNILETQMNRLEQSSALGMWKLKFLVVEPAKGEYKNTFAGEDGVSVYGTNPKLMPLLRMNPFSFPSDTHVLEHLDRLIEIFNVCWPMYAAMPAVLKNAVEKAYEDCGWDLATSTNEYGEDMYPTFADVARNVRSIIDNSDYDNDNKGAYKGSLLTRLNSLTNGINGIIFTINELTNEELFDNNVIVDLSRVGSSETKSLIMGMLVLKLQEYRMSSGERKINSGLNHVTVLEEAHNLLKRTSTEQISESSNLIGKSVEMLSNAIAEMRTYGEGFIIADQAPALLDMAAIRNTNTKIIMRLPDQSDRELVGKSANLAEDQITELAKLPCGVAAVYQNEWIQPVLCKINKHEINDKRYEYAAQTPNTKKHDYEIALNIAQILCNGTGYTKALKESLILPLLKKSNLTPYVQVCALKIIPDQDEEPDFKKIAPIISALFPGVKNAVRDAISESSDEHKWTLNADLALKVYINNIIDYDSVQSVNIRNAIIQAIITDYLLIDRKKIELFQKWYETGGLK